jgi:hypothetical protein
MVILTALVQKLIIGHKDNFMKPIPILILCFSLIFIAKCERKIVKIENCTANEKIAKVELCELKDGKFNGVFNILESMDEFMVRLFD